MSGSRLRSLGRGRTERAAERRRRRETGRDPKRFIQYGTQWRGAPCLREPTDVTTGIPAILDCRGRDGWINNWTGVRLITYPERSVYPRASTPAWNALRNR